jgi:peptidoglycan/LPS O-acetylase OafA/YrhL
MPKPVGSSQRYMPGLDGLRTIAVLAVIAYHLDPDLAPGGLLGVGVFFTLSGYYTSEGYRHRASLSADGLAHTFPASGESSDCVVQ